LLLESALLLNCGCKGTDYFWNCQTFLRLFSKKGKKTLKTSFFEQQLGEKQNQNQWSIITNLVAAQYSLRREPSRTMALFPHP